MGQFCLVARIYKDFTVTFRGIRMTNVLEDMFVKEPRVVLKLKIGGLW